MIKSYLSDSLGKDEKIHSSAKITHWVIYYLILEAAIILVVLHFLSGIDLLRSSISLPTPVGSIKVSLLMIAFVMSLLGIMAKSLRTVIYVFTTEIAITNLRVIYKTGLIQRHTLEVRVQRIEGANVSQSILGRILNFGDVVITGTGTNHLNIRHVDSPLSFRRSLLDSIPVGE